MRKVALFILSFVLFMFVGCKVNYKFLQNTTEIKTIEIVEVEYPKDIGINLIVLSVIEDKESFLQDFSRISCYMQAPPPEMYAGAIAIKILYYNGEYELIAHDAQAHYIPNGYGGEEYNPWHGHDAFDEQEFNTLIEKYMKQTE